MSKQKSQSAHTSIVNFQSRPDGMIYATIPLESEDFLLGTWHHDTNKGTFRIGQNGEVPSEFYGGATGYVNDLTAWITLMMTFGRV